jgi:hypothetical protein
VVEGKTGHYSSCLCSSYVNFFHILNSDRIQLPSSPTTAAHIAIFRAVKFNS